MNTFLAFFSRYFEVEHQDYAGRWYYDKRSEFTPILIAEYIMVEIDVNIFDFFLLSSLVKICIMTDYLIVISPDGRVIEPNFPNICNELIKSTALDFVSNSTSI